MTANTLRGEAEVTVGDVTLILAADMGGLARLSAATGHPSLQDLYSRLIGTEPFTVLAALRIFTQSGKRGDKEMPRAAAVEDACNQLAINDYRQIQEAFQKILGGLMRPVDEKDMPKPGEDAKNE